ncbi:Suppressor of Sensor Kinase (SLN1), partial [Ceratobasidium sp. 370]
LGCFNRFIEHLLRITPMRAGVNRRHHPTLQHIPDELEDADDEQDGSQSWNRDASRTTSYQSASSGRHGSFSPSSSTPNGSRFRLRQTSSYPTSNASNTVTSPSSSSRAPKAAPNPGSIYMQFTRKYRDKAADDDFYDPDRLFQRGLGQLIDQGDSDDEDSASNANSAFLTVDQYDTLVDSDNQEPTTPADRERLEWQTMLVSVLDSEVLRSETTRIGRALEPSGEERNVKHANIWYGIRARLHGRTEAQERERLNEKRLRLVDPVLEEVLAFRLGDDDDEATVSTTEAVKAINALLKRLERAESLYPTLTAMRSAKPECAEPRFIARVETLIQWINIFNMLSGAIAMLQRWTGSETLDVTIPTTAGSVPLRPQHHDGQTPAVEKPEATSFVERVLKEDTLQISFEKGAMQTLSSCIQKAREMYIHNGMHIHELGLPRLREELEMVISFPARLVKESIKVRLELSHNVVDPNLLQLEQMMDNYRMSIGLACTLKRQYEALTAPDPDRMWDISSGIDEDYDRVILDAMRIFFRLLNRKLKSGAKGIYFKETELLEGHWSMFDEVASSLDGGSLVVAERLCSLTNRFMIRITAHLEEQLQYPMQSQNRSKAKMREGLSSLKERDQPMTQRQLEGWYGKILDGVRLRYRKLQRFARGLSQRLSNSAEYTLEGVNLEFLINTLVESDYFLTYSDSFQSEGCYIVAHPSLRDQPEQLKHILARAFHLAHLPVVQREIRKITKGANKLAESIVGSVKTVKSALGNADGSQELLENWFKLASDQGQHSLKYMDREEAVAFNRTLAGLAIDWVAFICDSCDPTDRKTFRWAVYALEFTMSRTRGRNILRIPQEEFRLLQRKVSSLMTLLVSHFDLLGARASIEREREDQILKKERLMQTTQHDYDTESSEASDTAQRQALKEHDDISSRRVRAHAVRVEVQMELEAIEQRRQEIETEQHMVGRVLSVERPEDRSLANLAASSSNVSMRWQQGRFIGAGAFGSVYCAVNLDSGTLMAVKEVRFKDPSSISQLYKQVRDELSVMEMLHHPNVVEYYGIEVHRDKVYIFEEYCSGGSLADSLSSGRIEDETVTQVYTMQLLEGLEYLHKMGVIHRDIKPDNLLLDHTGMIKFADFGAAKVLARNHRSIQHNSRSRTSTWNRPSATRQDKQNSLTGTPMYMAPEIINNESVGRHGAMDIWSIGCVILECCTGRKPWHHLDNEWFVARPAQALIVLTDFTMSGPLCST